MPLCHCFSLKNGSLAAALYTIYVSSQAIFFYGSLLPICWTLEEEFDMEQARNASGTQQPDIGGHHCLVLGVDMSFFVILMLTSFVLLYGIRTNKMACVLLWLPCVVICKTVLIVHNITLLTMIDFHELVLVQLQQLHLFYLSMTCILLSFNLDGVVVVFRFYRNVTTAHEQFWNAGNQPNRVQPAESEGQPPGEVIPLNRQISLDDVKLADEIDSFSEAELRQILRRYFVPCDQCNSREELHKMVVQLYHADQENKQRAQEILNKMEEDLEVLTDGERSTPATKLSDPFQYLCKVCLDRVTDCVFLDCGHMVTCTLCSRHLSMCPVCRKSIKKVVHTFSA